MEKQRGITSSKHKGREVFNSEFSGNEDNGCEHQEISCILLYLSTEQPGQLLSQFKFD